jgi:hypothetical protein
MKLIAPLFVLLLSGQILASDDIHFNTPKKLMVINPVDSEIILSDVDNRLINKIVLKECAKQTEYQIAMGEIGISVDAHFSIFNVNITLTGEESNLTITGILLDEKNKIVVSKVERLKVKRLHLMRTVEDVMKGLFAKKLDPQLVK